MRRGDHRISAIWTSISYFRSALLDPHWPKAYYRLGMALKSLQRYHQSHDAFERGLSISSSWFKSLGQDLFFSKRANVETRNLTKILWKISKSSKSSCPAHQAKAWERRIQRFNPCMTVCNLEEVPFLPSLFVLSEKDIGESWPLQRSNVGLKLWRLILVTPLLASSSLDSFASAHHCRNGNELSSWSAITHLHHLAFSLISKTYVPRFVYHLG